MATTENSYTTSNATTTDFAFTFPYMKEADVNIDVAGVTQATTAYSFHNATTIRLNTAPASGVVVKVYRSTDDSGLTSTFYPGSAIRSGDLNDNFTQNLYSTQENTNDADEALDNSRVLESGVYVTAITKATEAVAAAAVADGIADDAADDVKRWIKDGDGTATSGNEDDANFANRPQKPQGVPYAVAQAVAAVASAGTANNTANAADAIADEALANSRLADGATPASPSGGYTTAIYLADQADTNAAEALSNSRNTATPPVSAISIATNALDNSQDLNVTPSSAIDIAQAAEVTATTALNNSRDVNATPSTAIAIAQAADTIADTAKLATDSLVGTTTDNGTTWTLQGDGQSNNKGVKYAVEQAEDAVVTANLASGAVAAAVLYTTVVDKSALEALTPTPDDVNDLYNYYQVSNSTGLANDTWDIGDDTYTLSGIPATYASSNLPLSGLTTKLTYTHSTKTFSYDAYTVNDADDRYMVGPQGPGTNGYFLQTDGSGGQTWAEVDTSTLAPKASPQFTGIAGFSADGILINNDLKFHIDSSADKNYISNTGSGSNIHDLILSVKPARYIQLETDDGSGTKETLAKFQGDGAAELYYNGTKKLETDSQGVNITGQLDVTHIYATGSIEANSFSPGDNSAAVTFFQVTNSGNPDTVDGRAYTSVYSTFNTHDAEDLFVELHEDTIFEIKWDNPNAYANHCISGSDHGRLASFKPQEGVKLFYNDSKKLETTSDGVDVTGALDVSGKLTVTGIDNDGQYNIKPGGEFFKFENSGAWSLSYDDSGSGSGWSYAINATKDYVKLYGPGGSGSTVVLETETGGVDVTGTLDVSDTITASGKITANASTGLQTKYLTIAKTADDGGDIDDPNNIIELYCQSDGATTRGLKIGSISSTSGAWGNQWVYDATHPSGAHYFNIEEKMRFAVYNNRTSFYSGTAWDEVARIQSDGNVGIGTSSPYSLLEINGPDGTISGISLGSGGSATASRYIGICHANDHTQIGANSGFSGVEFGGPSSTYEGYLGFHTHDNGVASGERMRIDKSGTIRCNMQDYTTAPSATNSGLQLFNPNVASAAMISSKSATTATSHIIFYNSNGGVGQIYTSGSATIFATSSDYRLKENVTAITDGITRVKQLQPKRFNFIADSDTTVDGFLAHEAQTVVPEAISGEKDQVDDDGDAVMQGIDQSKLVPLLTAALQEAITKIETLETKVAALEAA